MSAVSRPLFQILQGRRLLRPVRPSSQLRSSPHRWRRRIVYTRIVPPTASLYLYPSEL